MKKHRLKGFTLLEMLVSMALIGMVLMLGIFTYQSFVQIHQQYDQRLEQGGELAFLSYCLKRDVRHAHEMALLSPHRLCLWNQAGDTLAIYRQLPHLMIRHDNMHIDTFLIEGRWLQRAGGEISLLDDENLWEIPLRTWSKAHAKPLILPTQISSQPWQD